MAETSNHHNEETGTTPDLAPLSYPSIAPTPPKFDGGSSIPGYQPPAMTASGPPLPHRPKGRFFIATLLLCFVGGIGFYFYDSYVRYLAYGQVVGRKIELAPPWAGVVTALHVRVGDTVHQGDPLFNVDSIKMRHRMAQIEDSLNLQRARLAAELARLKWEAERVEDSQQLVRAEYYEKWSELLWEESVLSDLQQQCARAETLSIHDAIAVEKLESVRCRVAGQSQRIEQLSNAVQSLKRRLETDRPIDPNLNDQIKPSLVNIENLQAELRRTRHLLEQGVVKSPANGRVTQITKYSGEFVEDSGSVIELFVDGSAEIVLYLPQSKSRQWSTGDSLDVRIEPAAARLACEVTRVAPEMENAPKSITRHYAANEILLPIVVRPRDPREAEKLVLGSKVRLPRDNAESGFNAIATWLRGDATTATLEPNPVPRSRPVISAVRDFSGACRKTAVIADRGTTGWSHVFNRESQLFGERNPAQRCAAASNQVGTSAPGQTVSRACRGHESAKTEGEKKQSASGLLMPTDVHPTDSRQAKTRDRGSELVLPRDKQGAKFDLTRTSPPSDSAAGRRTLATAGPTYTEPTALAADDHSSAKRASSQWSSVSSSTADQRHASEKSASDPSYATRGASQWFPVSPSTAGLRHALETSSQGEELLRQHPEIPKSGPPDVVRSIPKKRTDRAVRGSRICTHRKNATSLFHATAYRLHTLGDRATVDPEPPLPSHQAGQPRIRTPLPNPLIVTTRCSREAGTFARGHANQASEFQLLVYIPPD